MKKILLTAFLLASCASKNIIQKSNETIINHHGGGVIHEVVSEINNYKKPIIIQGTCASSCTYVFRYKNTCVADNARLLFHAPRNKNGSINKNGFQIMANWYPKLLKKWFLTEAIDGRDYWFSGRDFKNLFNVGIC